MPKSWPNPKYEVRVTFDAPVEFVYRWCTDYTPQDARYEKDEYQRRILRRSPREVVYEDLSESKDGWFWSRHVVRLSPPNHWHSDTVGSHREYSLDYRLARLPGNRYSVDLEGAPSALRNRRKESRERPVGSFRREELAEFPKGTRTGLPEGPSQDELATAFLAEGRAARSAARVGSSIEDGSLIRRRGVASRCHRVASEGRREPSSGEMRGRTTEPDPDTQTGSMRSSPNVVVFIPARRCLRSDRGRGSPPENSFAAGPTRSPSLSPIGDWRDSWEHRSALGRVE